MVHYINWSVTIIVSVGIITVIHSLSLFSQPLAHEQRSVQGSPLLLHEHLLSAHPAFWHLQYTVYNNFGMSLGNNIHDYTNMCWEEIIAVYWKQTIFKV